MKIILLFGRILYSLMFLMVGFNHFMKPTLDYANSQGIPMAYIFVPISGLLAVVGALSVLLGYKAKFGAWLLVIFLLPVTLLMHNFWLVTDSVMAQIQMTMFLKNLSMLGAALYITYFGAGPLSLDEKIALRAAHQSKK